MFRDPLIPIEAVKLAALGFLADGPQRYGDLAAQTGGWLWQYRNAPGNEIAGS